VIALVGGLLLLGLGISYLHGALRGGMTLPAAQESSPQRRARALVLLGAGTTLANPFWYTWWVTVAAGYLLQVSGLSVAGLASFYLGHISADFAWNSSLAILVSTGKRWLTDSRYRALIVLTGGFMLYLGIIFISSAFQS
jgi:threonine/homoserine/homoserine lactone efflux protein